MYFGRILFLTILMVFWHIPYIQCRRPCNDFFGLILSKSYEFYLEHSKVLCYEMCFSYCLLQTYDASSSRCYILNLFLNLHVVLALLTFVTRYSKTPFSRTHMDRKQLYGFLYGTLEPYERVPKYFPHNFKLWAKSQNILLEFLLLIIWQIFYYSIKTFCLRNSNQRSSAEWVILCTH